MGGISATKAVSQATTAPRTFGFPMSPVTPAPKSNIKGGVARPAVVAPKPRPTAATRPDTREVYNSDVNANLKEAVIRGNEENTRTINRFEGTARGLANEFNSGTQNLNRNINAGEARLTNNLLRDSSKITNDTNNRVNASLGNYTNMSARLTDQTNAKNNMALNQYNNQSGALARQANADLDKSFNGYNQRTRSLGDAMGTTDKATHARFKGQEYAGLDSGFAEAGDLLQSSLAARGLSGSGIFAKSMVDLSRERMKAGAAANVNAYNQAINTSDQKRMVQMGNESTLYGADTQNIMGQYGISDNVNQRTFGATKDNNMSQNALGNSFLQSKYGAENSAILGNAGRNEGLVQQQFGAQQANLQGAYGRNMSQLGQNYGNRLGIEGQIMQNQLNNTQQRQANLMGYAQLGRGMAGMSQNYLASAGSGYQNIGQIAGNSAAQQGQLNNSYNAARWNAQAEQQSGKGSAIGTGIGAAATMFSDMRLKKNVKQIGEVNGHKLVAWDWNEKGLEIAKDMPTIGVIAQEAQKINPDAVITHESGYLMVDYSKIFKGAYDVIR